jgi:uncharacterized protein YegP (UPF0339 family)
MMYEVYADRTGAYRWQFQVPSGLVLAQSGGSYLNRRQACGALAEFRAAARVAGEARGCPEGGPGQTLDRPEPRT